MNNESVMSKLNINLKRLNMKVSDSNIKIKKQDLATLSKVSNEMSKICDRLKHTGANKESISDLESMVETLIKETKGRVKSRQSQTNMTYAQAA